MTSWRSIQRPSEAPNQCTELAERTGHAPRVGDALDETLRSLPAKRRKAIVAALDDLYGHLREMASAAPAGDDDVRASR